MSSFCEEVRKSVPIRRNNKTNTYVPQKNPKKWLEQMNLTLEDYYANVSVFYNLTDGWLCGWDGKGDGCSIYPWMKPTLRLVSDKGDFA